MCRTVTVDLTNVGLSTADDVLDIQVTSHGQIVPVKVTKKSEMYEAIFTPHHKGAYDVTVYCGGEEVPGSPFTVDVDKNRVVRAEGKGLHEALVGKSSVFQVDVTSSEGQLECHVTGIYMYIYCRSKSVLGYNC